MWEKTGEPRGKTHKDDHQDVQREEIIALTSSSEKQSSILQESPFFLPFDQPVPFTLGKGSKKKWNFPNRGGGSPRGQFPKNKKTKKMLL